MTNQSLLTDTSIQATTNDAEAAGGSPYLQELRDDVFDALRNSQDNGYDFNGWTDEQVAIDMQDCADFGEFSIDELIPFISEFRSQGDRKPESTNSGD